MGERVGRYTLGARLGSGGMAEVWAATVDGPHGFRKTVALKRILVQRAENPDFTDMFIDEARLAARLHHANIVQVVDFDEVDGALYLAMEMVDGRDLRRVLDQSARGCQRMPVAHATFVTGELLKALHYAHGLTLDGVHQGLVHRDVTPHNVLISFSGEVKLGDFGIAKVASKLSQTATGRVKGKLGYMSPEQIRGDPVDARTDLFAVGATAYEMMTGSRLYDADSEAELIGKVVHARFEPPRARAPALATDLEAVLLKLLAPRLEDRYASAGDAFRALQACRDFAADPMGLAAFLAELFREDIAPEPTVALPSSRVVARAEAPANPRTIAETQTRFAPLEPRIDAPAQPARSARAMAAPARTTGPLPETHTTLASSAGESEFLLATRPRRARLLWAGAGAAVCVAFGIWIATPGERAATKVAASPQPAAGSPPASGAEAPVAMAPPRVPVALRPPHTIEAALSTTPAAVPPEPPAATPRRRSKRRRETPATVESPGSPEPEVALTGGVRVVVLPWASVRVDGGDTQRTPLDLTLPAGHHRVVIENPGLGQREQIDVDLAAGARETIQRDWLP